MCRNLPLIKNRRLAELFQLPVQQQGRLTSVEPRTNETINTLTEPLLSIPRHTSVVDPDSGGAGHSRARGPPPTGVSPTVSPCSTQPHQTDCCRSGSPAQPSRRFHCQTETMVVGGTSAAVAAAAAGVAGFGGACPLVAFHP